MELGVKERVLPPTSTGIRRVVEDKVLWDTRLSHLSALVLITTYLLGGLEGDEMIKYVSHDGQSGASEAQQRANDGHGDAGTEITNKIHGQTGNVGMEES